MDRGQANHVLERLRALLAKQKSVVQTGDSIDLAKKEVNPRGSASSLAATAGRAPASLPGFRRMPRGFTS